LSEALSIGNKHEDSTAHLKIGGSSDQQFEIRECLYHHTRDTGFKKRRTISRDQD